MSTNGLLVYDDDEMQNNQLLQHQLSDEQDQSLEQIVANLQNQFEENENKDQQIQGKRKSSDQRFTLQEDKQILKLVSQVGPNFNKIVKYFPGKTMNMVKNRYYKKLRYIKEDLQSDQEENQQHSKTKKSH